MAQANSASENQYQGDFLASSTNGWMLVLPNISSVQYLLYQDFNSAIEGVELV